MNSPFTGGHATLVEEKATTVYRGEKFDYTRRYYRCDDTGIAFTDDETDAWSLEQIHSQYREKYGIPAPEEIKAIREQYGLSATTMSKILGIGDNQYGLYENGEMPTKNIGRMIATIKDKNIFSMYVDMAKNQFTEKENNRIREKVAIVFGTGSYYIENNKYSSQWLFVLPIHPVIYKETEVARWSKKSTNQTIALV